MKPELTIAAEEWRYWRRTKLGVVAVLLAFLLICVSILSTLSQIERERNTRVSLQVQAQETFRDQPARHPHRMVHYGHYVFRTPTPLAPLDPGVEPYTGTVMFLEGHRQNSAMFSPSYEGARAGPFSYLTPALSYQLLLPLVLIVIGFSAVARERAAAMDRQLMAYGVSPTQLWLGKSMALAGVAGILLVPLLIGVLVVNDEVFISLSFFVFYLAYTLVWVSIITAVSTYSKTASASLLVLLVSWAVLCVLLPRTIASAATTAIPTASKIEADMDAVVALRKVGDGHSPNDPAFNRLRANLLEQYGVESVEDLPINFRGVVAKTSEAEQAKVLNKYAEARIEKHVAQTGLLRSLEFVSPFMALQSASMIVAGTDGQTHHRFLREAESARIEFVQSLNEAHIEELSYADDINRSKNDAANQRARVSAENWRMLKDFEFNADAVSRRVERSMSSFYLLLLWLMLSAMAGFVGAQRLSKVDHG